MTTKGLKAVKCRLVERKRIRLEQKRKEVAISLIRNSKAIKELRSQKKGLLKAFLNLKHQLKQLEVSEMKDLADEGEPSRFTPYISYAC